MWKTLASMNTVKLLYTLIKRAFQARVQLSNANSMSLSPVTFDASTFTEESPVGAISMLNMLNGVMAAFKQQVKDARILGEQEGRKAQQHEFEDVINKARNDGYRDAMTY